MLTNEEINALVRQIQALPPQTKEIVLLCLDLMTQAKRTGQGFPEIPKEDQ